MNGDLIVVDLGALADFLAAAGQSPTLIDSTVSVLRSHGDPVIDLEPEQAHGRDPRDPQVGWSRQRYAGPWERQQ